MARNIGIQISSLVAALDEQDLDKMVIFAEQLQRTADQHGAVDIALKAKELQESFNSEQDDLYEMMQAATELLDLCRSTQSALLDRPDFAVAAP